MLPLILTSHRSNLLESIWTTFTPRIFISRRVEIDFVEQLLHALPFIGVSLCTVFYISNDYDKAQHYIFTRMKSKLSWYLKKCCFIVIHSALFMTTFIILCISICCVFSDKSPVNCQSYWLIISYISIGYIFLGICMSLCGAVLAIILKEIFSLLFVWSFFIIIPSMAYYMLLNQKLYYIIKYIPLSTTYCTFNNILINFQDTMRLSINIFEIPNYTLIFRLSFLLTLFLTIIVMGYIILQRQKFFKLRRRKKNDYS